MSLELFIQKIHRNETISFYETIEVIHANYHYQAAEFSNGELINLAGTNEGSCKIFAFAMKNGLDEQQTLNLFGDFYHQDVLGNPNDNGHPNIRNFMRYGWRGVQFSGNPLTAK